MDVLRINAAHSDHATHSAAIAMYRQACSAAGKPPCVMVDIQGSEVRTAWLVDKTTRAPVDSITLTAGQAVTLCGAADTSLPAFVGWSDGDDTRIGVGLCDLAGKVAVGDTVRMSDGSVEIQITDKLSNSEVRGCIISDCKLGSHKMVFIQGVNHQLPFLSGKDRKDVEWAVREGVDCIAASFARCQEDMEDLQQMLQSLGASSTMQCALGTLVLSALR